MYIYHLMIYIYIFYISIPSIQRLFPFGVPYFFQRHQEKSSDRPRPSKGSAAAYPAPASSSSNEGAARKDMETSKNSKLNGGTPKWIISG